MAERETLVSVDLGEGAFGVLEELQRKLKKTRSEIIRSAVLGYAACELWNLKVKTLPTARKRRPKFKLTQDQRDRLVTFHSKLNKKAGSKPYWPAVYSCMKTIMEGGYSFDEVMSALQCAAEDDIIKAKITVGQAVPLHSLLSEKMFGRLVELAANKVIEEATEDTEQLVDVKNEALSTLATIEANPGTKAEVYDKIQWAETKEEVQQIMHDFFQAMNEVARRQLLNKGE